MSRLDQMMDTLQRPAWVSVVLSLTKVGAVTLALSGLAVFGVTRYPELARVQSVQVNGAVHSGQGAVRHLADIRVGESLLLLDTERTLAQVESHPWVDRVTLHRELGGEVVIEVVEHRERMLLSTHRGLYRVNDRGEPFVRARTTGLDLPVLTGLSPELLDQQGPLAQRVVRDALQLLDAWEQSPHLSSDSLSELHFDPLLGFSVLLRNGTRIRMGYRSPDQAISRLEAMLDHGLDLSQPLDVDLDMDGMAVAAPLAS
ncbi:MAG: FtsQ-type POTRA domain-containing protein [Myxococcota bacterium]|nr:FtsQ-type POTRA domain-containing protein [Myxococcota bacterium]